MTSLKINALIYGDSKCLEDDDKLFYKDWVDHRAYRLGQTKKRNQNIEAINEELDNQESRIRSICGFKNVY